MKWLPPIPRFIVPFLLWTRSLSSTSTLACCVGVGAWALPHYLVVAVFAGGGWSSGVGLIKLLGPITGIVLTFTGCYLKGIFDFVPGMNGWVYRVAAHAALMPDTYPPFRLDMGGQGSPPATAAVQAIAPNPAPQF